MTGADTRQQIHVEEATRVDDELLAAITSLVPQLSSSAPAIGVDSLREICASPTTCLLIARDDDETIVGTLTLVVFRIPTGVRAWIEDVVVDIDHRGRGVGEELVRAAMKRAVAAQARTIDLTSRSSRVEALRLYKRLGFETYETNFLRSSLNGDR